MDQVYVIRHKVLVEKQSVRRVARELGVSRNTVRRYVEGATPCVRVPVVFCVPMGCPRGGAARCAPIGGTLNGIKPIGIERPR